MLQLIMKVTPYPKLHLMKIPICSQPGYTPRGRLSSEVQTSPCLMFLPTSKINDLIPGTIREVYLKKTIIKEL